MLTPASLPSEKATELAKTLRVLANRLDEDDGLDGFLVRDAQVQRHARLSESISSFMGVKHTGVRHTITIDCGKGDLVD